MIKMRYSTYFLSLLVGLCSLSLFSCSNSNSWTVDGQISGADGQTMLVEACDNGRWYPLDSIKLDAGGHFKIEHEASGYPDIYRLRLGDKTLYFPIDSVETVTVIAQADAFDTDYTLEGSPSAAKLMEVDRQLRAAMTGRNSLSNIETDSVLKRELGRMLLGDPSGIVSYYIINKRIGNASLFNPANKSDLRLIGAVANAYDQFRPNDPRTAYLRNLYLSNRSGANAPTDTIYASEVGSFEIKLYDNKGREQSLHALAQAGKPVLLNFTAYSAEQSPAFNRELNRIYSKYHAKGLEIFQVAIDEDELQWRQAAANLPWITVYNPPSDGRILINYNVTDIPATFLINSKGEIVERVLDITNIDASIGKIF